MQERIVGDVIGVEVGSKKAKGETSLATFGAMPIGQEMVIGIGNVYESLMATVAIAFNGVKLLAVLHGLVKVSLT